MLDRILLGVNRANRPSWLSKFLAISGALLVVFFVVFIWFASTAWAYCNMV